MIIQFPPYYPLEKLLQKETKEIVQTGFPYFDLRWLRNEESSLKNICLNSIVHSPSLLISEDLKNLPVELLEKIDIKYIQNRVFNATQEIFLWVNSPENPNKKNNVFQFLNEYVFDKFFVAFPTLDITKKDIEVGNDEFSIDISLSDFEINKPILRLMRENACVGISFLLEMENGSNIPWTLMQGHAEDPHIWCPFQKCLLCPPSTFLNIEDLEQSQKYAQEAIEEILIADNSQLYLDPIDLINFWRSQNNIYLLVKTLRQLVSGKSIDVIDSADLIAHVGAGTMPAVVKGSLAGCH